MEILLNGVFFGLLLAVFIGPVFFALIQTSIEKGFGAGVMMALGVSLSDSIYIFLTYLGISQFLDNLFFKVGLGLAGGVIMVLFGMSSFLKPEPELKPCINHEPGNDRMKLVVKGFFLNGINPFVLLFWVGIVSMVSVDYEYSTKQVYVFFIGIIGTVLFTDVLKSYIAGRLRNIITPHFMKIMNRIVGVALMLFGLRLFVFALENQGIIDIF
jgi:threonine/homoserine/homoserine lactone efflux protein